MDSHQQADNLGALIDAAAEMLSDLDDQTAPFESARETVVQISDLARDAERAEMADCARLLAALIEIAGCAGDGLGGDSSETESMIDFLKSGLETLREAREQEACEAGDRLGTVTREAHERWGDYLALVEPTASTATDERFLHWEEALPDDEAAGAESVDGVETEAGGDDTSAEQIEMILSAVGGTGSDSGEEAAAEREAAEQDSSAPDRSSQRSSGSAPPRPAAPPTSREDLDIDEGLLEAFLDDAGRCMAAIEESVFNYEADPTKKQPLQQLGRELHTLKGASASVGLSDLAKVLHETEDFLLARSENDAAELDLDPVLQTIDAVRNQIRTLTGAAPEEPGEAPNSQEPAAEGAPTPSPRPEVNFTPEFDGGGGHGEESLRVKVAQLDRLTDMLAELVMLRNRRENRVEHLQHIHDEVNRCVTRLRVFADGLYSGTDRTDASGGAAEESDGLGTAVLDAPARTRPQRTYTLTEIGSDLWEIARNLRALYQPVAEENLIVSRFIRQFRQELAALRRVPVQGLFRRLQRAARDAARAEGKQVRLEFVGEQAGLERSLQERLYEPLLHLVRNAVSHGIEEPRQRDEVGKDSVGTITLKAQSGPNLLVLEIQDDGKGLDYDALRRRGIERGLLSAGRPAGREELAQLIFQPGFSTRQQVGEVSGRGVGMDVVAETLRQMHSTIDVDSTPGRGMAIRLTVPLRSTIEHAMVFRAGGQVFALPMGFVQTAGPWDSGQTGREDDVWHQLRSDRSRAVRTDDLLGLSSPATGEPDQVLVLGPGGFTASGGKGPADGSRADDARVALLVEEIVGPEEVVVRPLPPLLRGHQLLAGTTLSGSGETVLLLDGHRLIEGAFVTDGPDRAAQRGSGSGQPDARSQQDAPQVLIVDDSLTARRSLVQLLQRRGFVVREFGDGFEALECLRAERFQIVFTDLEMPRLNGLELLHEIKCADQTQTTPVVVVSSRSDEELRGRARELGAEEYLIKPLTEQMLTDLLEKLGLSGERLPR